MSLKTRATTEVFLIGFPKSQILGAKLPTCRQLIQTYFYNRNIVNLNPDKSALLTVKEAIIFWEKARIDTKRIDHCVEKLTALITEWKNLQKNEKSIGDNEKKKRETFTNKLDLLFDIAHESALDKLKDDDKQFLLNQRSKNREGCLMGVDEKQTKKTNVELNDWNKKICVSVDIWNSKNVKKKVYLKRRCLYFHFLMKYSFI